MSHPLVVALFSDLSRAAAAARELHAAGVASDQLSVISRNHDEESNYAAEIGGSPGAEIEDSRTAARFGELSGYFLAAIALVLPGIGPIVAAGPLAAGHWGDGWTCRRRHCRGASWRRNSRGPRRRLPDGGRGRGDSARCPHRSASPGWSA